MLISKSSENLSFGNLDIEQYVSFINISSTLKAPVVFSIPWLLCAAGAFLILANNVRTF
jgi:hypothetical protein